MHSSVSSAEEQVVRNTEDPIPTAEIDLCVDPDSITSPPSSESSIAEDPIWQQLKVSAYSVGCWAEATEDESGNEPVVESATETVFECATQLVAEPAATDPLELVTAESPVQTESQQTNAPTTTPEGYFIFLFALVHRTHKT